MGTCRKIVGWLRWGPRCLNSIQRHSLFLNSTQRHVTILKSTCDTPWRRHATRFLYLRQTTPALPTQKSIKVFFSGSDFGSIHLWKCKQEAQGLGALLDKMEDNDHINWITQRSRGIFHSKKCRFRDTRFLKIRNTPNDPRMTHLSVKSSLCALNTQPLRSNFNPFRSTTSHFRDTGLPKIGMHRMTPEWP